MKPEPQRLLYFANVRVPSERANSIQIMQMCAAFAKTGLEVALYHPRRVNRFTLSAPTLHEHYGVAPSFETNRLYSLDLIDRVPRALQPPAFRIQALTFGLAACRVMRKSGGISYLRDNTALALAALLLPERLRRTVFYEAHDFPVRPRSARALLKAALRCGGVVAITTGLSERFMEGGIARERLHVAPDGVDLDRFQDLPEKEDARSRLSLPAREPLAVYTGQLFPWKGVETLIEAAARLPGWRILIVGGRPEDRRRLETAARDSGARDRILFRDPVPPSGVPLHLRAADVLVLPNSGRFPISAHYTSPMKLFEYMAAGRPVAASDLPSLREVLTHEKNALLVPADDPGALAQALARLLTDKGLTDRLVSHARKDAARFTWQERAGGIRRFLDRRSTGKEEI